MAGHEAEGEAEADADAPAGRAARLRALVAADPLLLVAAALVMVPALAAMASALRHPWYPTNDWALLELQVRDVFTRDTPLVGAWSRFGWRHPGPLPFYLMAVPYRLVPADRGLLFATATVNAVAVAAYAAVALRQGRARALVALSALAVVQLGLGADALSDPWNPTTPLIPFALYALLCVDLAANRHRWTLPALAFTGSLIIQSHVGFAQPVLLMGVVAVALRWYREGRTVRPVGARPALVTAAVLSLCWLPVVIDQVARSGNFGMIVRWAFGDELTGGMGELTQRPMGTREGVGAAAWLLNPVGFWLGRFEPHEAFGFELLRHESVFLLLWVPIVLVGALVVARRARRGSADAGGPVGDAWPVTCMAVVAAAGALALVSDVLSARGLPVVWPFRWAAVVAMLVWTTAGWAAVALLRGRATASARLAGRARLAGALVVGVLVAVPVGVTVFAGSLGQRPEQASSEAIGRIVPAIEAHAGREDLAVANTKVLLNDVDLGLPVVLERAGIPWVERDDPRAAGHPRLYLARSNLLQDAHIARLVDEGKIEVLAGSGPGAPGDGADGDVLLLRAAPGLS